MNLLSSCAPSQPNWTEHNPRQADLAKATRLLDEAQERQPRPNEALSEVEAWWDRESIRLRNIAKASGHLMLDHFAAEPLIKQRSLAPTLESLLCAVDHAQDLEEAYDYLAEAASVITRILVNGWKAYGFDHATFWPHLPLSETKTAAAADVVAAYDAHLISRTRYAHSFKLHMSYAGGNQTDLLLKGARAALPLTTEFATPAELKAAWAIKLRTNALRMALQNEGQSNLPPERLEDEDDAV